MCSRANNSKLKKKKYSEILTSVIWFKKIVMLSRGFHKNGC